MFVLGQHLHALFLERVAIRFAEDLFVVALQVAQHLNFSARDDAHIDIGARAQIVVNTALNGFRDQFDRLFARHVFFVTIFDDGHSCERA